MAERKYRGQYVSYEDKTDVGADGALLSPESRAVVAQGKKIWQKGYETGDQDLMDQGHAMAEGERAKAGYSGGANGGAYNPFAQDADGERGVHASGTHMASPTWTDPYRSARDSAIGKLQSRQPFSYDPETDPAYQQYKEQYTREGKRAMDDTLAKVSARTGGLASSYAASAASQANNYYMQQLADKVPELRQLAYQMYMDEGDRLRADAQMYGSLSANDANIWQGTALQPFQSDRDYALSVDRDLYDRGVTERQMGLQQAEFDRQGDWHREERDDIAYDRAEAQKAKEEQKALEFAQLIAQGGDYSGYGGVYSQMTPEQITALEGLAREQLDYDSQARALELEGKRLDVELGRKQVANYGKSGGGGTQKTGGIGASAAYKDVAKKALKYEDQAEAKAYLEGMVGLWEESGGTIGISPKESYYIYTVLLGGTFEEEKRGAAFDQIGLLPKVGTDAVKKLLGFKGQG